MSYNGKFITCDNCAYRDRPKSISCIGCNHGRNYFPRSRRQSKVSYADMATQDGRRRVIEYKKYLDTIIEKVIFNPPATIVLWSDGFPKTVVKCQPGDVYDREKGLAMCIAKRCTGNTSAFCDVFKKWCGDSPVAEFGKALRNDLIVTAATRGAYMHTNGEIDIPSGIEGERHYADWVEKIVDAYLSAYRAHTLAEYSFDEYVEKRLKEMYDVDRSTWPKENPHINVNPIYETRKELRDEFLVRAAGELQHMSTTGVITPPADYLKARKYVVDVVDEYVNNPDVHTGDFWDYINIVFRHDFGKENKVKGEN